MPDRAVNLEFPVGGLDRRRGLQKQAPYTTPNCRNVRAFDVIESRGRGGSRPGIGKAFAEQLGSGNPVRMLTSVRRAEGWNPTTYTEPFSGSGLVSAGADWDAAGWTGIAGSATLSGGAATFPDTTTIEERGDVLTAAAAVPAVGQSYTARWLVDKPPAGLGGAYVYRFYLRLNNASPNPATGNGLMVKVYQDSLGLVLYEIWSIVSGSATQQASGTTATGASTDWVEIEVNVDTVRARYGPAPWITYNCGTSDSSNRRIAYTIERVAAPGLTLNVYELSITYYDDNAAVQPRVVAVASSNGDIYREITAGSLTAHTLTLSLSSTERLMAVPYLGMLYIADFGEVLRHTNGSIATNNRLSSASVADWTAALGADAVRDNWIVEIIRNGSGGSTVGVYAIESIQTGYIELGAIPGGGDPGNSIAADLTFRVVRSPKVYDPTNSGSGALTRWTPTAGTHPVNCPILTLFNNRMVFAGDPENPGMWYMARQDDPLDFDYTATDVARAIYGASEGSGGMMPAPITAAIAYERDYLIFGMATGIRRGVGDPTLGGGFETLSPSVGILDRFSVAVIPGEPESLEFLASDGWYALPPGASAPAPISRERLPAVFNHTLSPDDRYISLGYDPVHFGSVAALTRMASTPTDHVWLDKQLPGYWTDRFASPTQDPVVLHDYRAADPGRSAMLMGCRDGYVRKFDTDYTTDDGLTMMSEVDIGPFRSSTNDRLVGTLDELQLVLANTSGVLAAGGTTVTISVFAAHDAESCYTTAAKWTGTAADLSSRTHYPRVRGRWLMIRLSATSKWALEMLQVGLSDAGLFRT